MRSIHSWAAAVVVLTICFGGQASGQTVSFLNGFPTATNPQGRQDGSIYFAGTTQFAQGFQPTVTINAMATSGGLVYMTAAQLTPVTPSPPGTMTFNFGSATQPLNTNVHPNNTYYVWAILRLSNGMTNVWVTSAWATVFIANGLQQGPELVGSTGVTAELNGANQIVGTVAVTIPKPYDMNTEPNGWSLNGNMALYGLLSGNPVNASVVPTNNAPATQNKAKITITNVPAGKYKLFGTTPLKQGPPDGNGATQLIGSPLSADYTVSNP